MASSFDRWEKDPFFSAAEEVQESADRMESTYRTWVHSKNDTSNIWNSDELHRDLHTALGTTKWQLEEFARAVRSSYRRSSGEDAIGRHNEFINAIEDHVSRIECSLQESAVSEGRTSVPWVHLNEGEFDELALFLSPPSVARDNIALKIVQGDKKIAQEMAAHAFSKNPVPSMECVSLETREEIPRGHRRTASANADFGSWKAGIAEDDCHLNSSNVEDQQSPQRVPFFSGILSSVETASKFKWPKNGVRKWRASDSYQGPDILPLRSSQLTKGIDACYEKSKNCLDGYDDCDKQLYGWHAALQRQLQRSQYQMQYSRPIQVAISVVILLCLTVLIAFRAL